ncbi:cupin domain-containing protein [Arthrobacter sp. I2-34]|uniref:Cupin domain-containing protein n=1 Tax=Arthrobacter hankyongi TaxID=2904801 RepID=A0ABS9L7F1_9MICC|nr:cupin domain-containing protein [Arthrobacter hankyongi]MCG2622601.1 cupin domain-containing protein [Arthrobacter hankyongi]
MQHTAESAGLAKYPAHTINLIPASRPGPDAPRTSSVRVWEDTGTGQAHGIWEMQPGTLTGVEGPETVVVLEGSATVASERTGERVDVSAGDLLVLAADESCTWVVHERVRKFFVINPSLAAR